jgi:DNA polymerase I-like protein with 3'-5' exonuclease and polymerase domains
MIYFVSLQTQLFEDPDYICISFEESLSMMQSWGIIQVDTETSGRDAHLCDLLLIQFGNDKEDARIVVDTSTVDVCLYKNLLESRRLILQNAKFDLQFLYNHNIIPLKIYDTMIVEQLLYLGYPSGQVSYSLKEIAKRRLHIDIDKTVRGEIQWRGLDKKVIIYAAGDVTYLEQIMLSQLADLKAKGLMKAAQIECDFIPAIAYLEWCGIHLDEDKWKKKMQKDKQNLDASIKALDNFVTSNPKYSKYTFINRQGDLFLGFDLTPKCTIKWSSSQQVVDFAKFLGFDTKVQDKKTGEDKDSAMEKHLKKQKGINDEFLRLYFGKGNPEDDDYYPGYSGSFKVVSSFGQGHLNAINPKTNRIHTIYKQLGAASGRMSCGSQQPNTDLAKYKHIPANSCTYPNMQQLPHDAETRACFTAPEGYLWSSCDFSALESRLGADIYNEKSMLDEFLHGSGDMHSLCAYMVYKKEIPRDTPIKEIKKKYPHLRSAVKPIELNCEDS